MESREISMKFLSYLMCLLLVLPAELLAQEQPSIPEACKGLTDQKAFEACMKSGGKPSNTPNTKEKGNEEKKPASTVDTKDAFLKCPFVADQDKVDDLVDNEMAAEIEALANQLKTMQETGDKKSCNNLGLGLGELLKGVLVRKIPRRQKHLSRPALLQAHLREILTEHRMDFQVVILIRCLHVE